jgi:hypothetical protein
MTVLVTRAGDVLTPSLGPSSKPPSRHEHPTPVGRSRIAGRLSVPDRQDADS